MEIRVKRAMLLNPAAKAELSGAVIAKVDELPVTPLSVVTNRR